MTESAGPARQRVICAERGLDEIDRQPCRSSIGSTATAGWRAAGRDRLASRSGALAALVAAGGWAQPGGTRPRRRPPCAGSRFRPAALRHAERTRPIAVLRFQESVGQFGLWASWKAASRKRSPPSSRVFPSCVSLRAPLIRRTTNATRWTPTRWAASSASSSWCREACGSAGKRVRLTAQLIRAAGRDAAVGGELRAPPDAGRHLCGCRMISRARSSPRSHPFRAGVIAGRSSTRRAASHRATLSAYECTIRANEIMWHRVLGANPIWRSAPASKRRWRASRITPPHGRCSPGSTPTSITQDLNKSGTAPIRASVALAAARRAIELAPANSMARFAMARASYLMRDLDVFYAEAERALSLNPHEPFLLGNIWATGWPSPAAGRKALSLIRKAIELNPKVYPRWWHAALGKEHYRKGEYREALARVQEHELAELVVEPGRARLHLWPARRHGERAAPSVTKLLELYPELRSGKGGSSSTRSSASSESYIDHAVERPPEGRRAQARSAELEAGKAVIIFAARPPLFAAARPYWRFDMHHEIPRRSQGLYPLRRRRERLRGVPAREVHRVRRARAAATAARAAT